MFGEQRDRKLFWFTKLSLQKFTSYEDFINKFKDHVDYYNTKRIKPKVKGMSPVVYLTHPQRAA